MKKEEKLVRFLEYRGISTTRPLGNVKTKKMDKARSITEDYNAVVGNINTIFGYEEPYITVYDVVDYDKSVGYHFLNVEAAPETEIDENVKNVNEVLKVHPLFLNYILNSRYQPMVKMFNTEKVLKLLEYKNDWAEQTEHLISKFAVLLNLPEDKQPGTLEDMYHMLILQPVNNQKFSKKLLKLGEFNLIRAVQLLDIKLTPEKNELIKYIVNEVNSVKIINNRTWIPLSVEDYVNILSIGNIAGDDLLDGLIMNKMSKEQLSEYLVLKDMDTLIANEAIRVAEYYETQPELKEV